jgi:phosphatidylglycerol:prolipoprotein diacylglycerol transferase
LFSVVLFFVFFSIPKAPDDAFFVHNINPFLFRLGFYPVNYYTLFAAATAVIGFFLFRWQLRRGGYPAGVAWTSVPLLVVFLVVCIRLAHCVFYNPKFYFSDPRQILRIFRGGLSSHGALAGALIALAITAGIFKARFADLCDRFCFSSAAGASLVRLGNFFQTEVMGRETGLPWGVRFMRYHRGDVIRHPSQIYEFLFGALVLAVLLAVDNKAGGEKRPRGLIAGVFLVLYFTGRFFLEFAKEYQILDPAKSPLTMGQWLSIPPALFGSWVLYRIWKA